MVIGTIPIAAPISRPPFDPLLRRQSIASAPALAAPSTATRPEDVPASAAYPGSYTDSTSGPQYIYRRQSTLNPFPMLPSRFELVPPSRRKQSISSPSGGFLSGSSTTTSATSAQVYARLYDTLVEKRSERARTIAASSPRAKVEQWLPTVKNEDSPTRKRRQTQDTVENDSTASETSPAKKTRLDDEDENLDAIKEEEEEMVVGGAEGQLME